MLLVLLMLQVVANMGIILGMVNLKMQSNGRMVQNLKKKAGGRFGNDG